MLSAAFVGLVLAAEPCEAPRVHDVAPLVAAIAQDKAMAQGFLLGAGACATPGDACTKARLECAGLLNTTALNQQNFDEGIWLRDMLLPYLGAYYPMGRAFPAAPLASDGSCNVDVSTLNQAGQRRASQATRRDGLLSEYKLYQQWAQTQWQQCKDKIAALGAKDVAARQAAEQQAAAAAAIAAAAAVKAEEDRKARAAAEALAKQQQTDKDAALAREQQTRDAAAAEQKRREQVDAQRQQELLLAQQRATDAEQRRQQDMLTAQQKATEAEQRRQADLRDAQFNSQQKAADAESKRQLDLREQEARLQQNARDAALAEQKRRESVEDRRIREARDAEREKQERDFKAAEEARIAQEKQRKEEQARAEAAEAQRKRDEQDAAEQKKREEEAAARKAKEEEENRLVGERDSNVIAQKAAKQKLLKDAEDQLAAAREAEVQKKQAAVDAVNSSPAIASQLVADAAEAEKARVAAEKNYEDAKKKASEMVIDVSHERGGGSLYANFGAAGLDNGFGLLGLLGVHFGIWGTAPMNGMASGLEIGLWGRFLGQIAPANMTTHPHTAVDALLTARYFFGHFGIGIAGDLKAPVLAPNDGLRFGGGLSMAVAFVDNHETRVVLALTYAPLSNHLNSTFGALEWARLLLDFEISYKILSIHAQAQTFAGSNSVLHWQAGGALGIRFGW